MDLRSQQIKDTYGNILTTGTTAGAPLTGTLQNGQGSNVTAITLEGSLTAQQVNSDNLRLDGNTISSTDTNGNVLIQPNGTGDVVINESGADVDFRVEGQTDQNLLFVDASTNRVGIGTASPAQLLSLEGTSANILLSGTNNSYITYNINTSNIGYVGDANWLFGGSSSDFGLRAANNLIFGIGANERMRIDSSGNVGMNAIPENSSGTWRNYQLGSLSMAGRSSNSLPDAMFGTNFKFTTANAEQRISAYATSRVFFNDDVITFQNAGSDTAGSVISWNERMRIDSSGNVGIGVTPSTKLSVGDGTGVAIQNINSSTGGAIRFDKASTNTCFLGDTQSALGSGDGLVIYTYSGATRPILFYPQGTIKARIDSDGLKFGTDTAAANALDDYEEGTWTMGVAFGGASAGVTYTQNTGQYTKIGRQVTVTGYLQLSNKGSSTGDATITGLPFTIGNGTSYYAFAGMFFENVSFANQYQGYTIINSTTVGLAEITEAGSASSLTNSDFANNSTVMVSLTYFV